MTDGSKLVVRDPHDIALKRAQAHVAHQFGHCFVPSASKRLSHDAAAEAIRVYLESMREAERKMTPREPTREMNDMVFEYGNCAPMWRYMWDAAR